MYTLLLQGLCWYSKLVMYEVLKVKQKLKVRTVSKYTDSALITNEHYCDPFSFNKLFVTYYIWNQY